MSKQVKNTQRMKRHARVRAKISGTSQCPRLNVFRSLRSVSVQVINDDLGFTLIHAATKEVEKVSKNNDVNRAHALGKLIADKCLKKDIKEVVFDRGGYKYHGKIRALAEGAREGGLVF